MTCEVCGKSRMDVRTVDFSVAIKATLCVPCNRELDTIVGDMSQRYIKEARETLLNIIAAGKEKGDNKLA